MWPNPQEIPDLVTFTEEILNGKLHFYAVWIWTLTFRNKLLVLVLVLGMLFKSESRFSRKSTYNKHTIRQVER